MAYGFNEDKSKAIGQAFTAYLQSNVTVSAKSRGRLMIYLDSTTRDANNIALRGFSVLAQIAGYASDQHELTVNEIKFFNDSVGGEQRPAVYIKVYNPTNNDIVVKGGNSTCIYYLDFS